MKITPVATYAILFHQWLSEDGHWHSPCPVDTDTLRTWYGDLIRTRAFDKKAVALQRTGQLGTYAACLGQEAIGVAIGRALQSNDVFIPAYREYAAQFLRGVPMEKILQYWGGDEAGMAYPEGTPSYQDFPLSVPISTHIPHAVGVAYAFKLKKEARVVLASCGDGATSKGDFYEAVSSAKVWNLPIVFWVSNNQWAISLPREKQTGAQTIAQKALSGGINGIQVDGNDVVACIEVLKAALERARNGEGPQFIEAVTYRLHDHTTADDARRYRDEAEVKAAWERCPIKRLKIALEAMNAWSESDEASLQAEATAAAEAAAQAFSHSVAPKPVAMFEHLYASLPASLASQRDEVAAMTLPAHH
jgi:pyruvate dehydrogenase E1 component alpha subunit